MLLYIAIWITDNKEIKSISHKPSFLHKFEAVIDKNEYLLKFKNHNLTKLADHITKHLN